MNSRGAKLAHQRASNDEPIQRNRFTFAQVLSVTEFEGRRVAVVELDDSGEIGLVSTLFVHPSAAGTGWTPSLMACPAVYCTVRRAQSIAAWRRLETIRSAAA